MWVQASEYHSFIQGGPGLDRATGRQTVRDGSRRRQSPCLHHLEYARISPHQADTHACHGAIIALLHDLERNRRRVGAIRIDYGYL
jgi:hypothetical protein